MRSDELTYSLEECLDALIDYRGKTPKKVEAGIPLITAKVVKSGRIETPDEFIAEEDYEAWMTRGYPEIGDVVLTTEAPLGEVAQIKFLPVALAQRIVTLRGKSDLLDSSYLLYLMQSQEMQAKLVGRSSGTTVIGIKQSELRKIEVLLPPITEQRAIDHILGTLDEKIELNRKQNETLEAMARALFKAWFVDFEPVRAKMEGRWVRGQSLPALPAHLFDFFPDKFVESELGEIPQGWFTGSIGKVAVHPRRSMKPDEIEDETPYIALDHMPKRCIALAEWDTANGLESNKYEFKRGEILFGKLRPYFHKIGVAPLDGVCSTDIVVIAPKLPMWFGFVLTHVSSDAFVEYANAGSTGTKMPRTSWAEMARYPIVLPCDDVVAAFNLHITSTCDQIIDNIHESKTLAQLRDTLLPKLISGELRVRDAERLIETTL
jgi:type I restriction enzyme S subunit